MEETAHKEITSPVKQDQNFRQKVVEAAQTAGHQNFRVEHATPVTSETQIKSEQLQQAGAVSKGEDISLIEDTLDILGSELKYARSDVTGESKIRQGSRAKRFLAVLKGKLLKKAQQEGGELKEAA